MTRVGWAFLGLLFLAAAALVSMTSFGGHDRVEHAARARPGVKVINHLEAVVRGAVGGGDALPRLIVPVAGIERGQVVDTWGQARSEGRAHHGTDIPAAGGTPVIAAADGVIEKLFQSGLGGTTLYERSLDRRWTFYYAHLAAYAPGLHEGQTVRAGETVAFVGDTGDAGTGNFHLHFGLSRTTADQRWFQGEDVNAFPALAGTAPRR